MPMKSKKIQIKGTLAGRLINIGALSIVVLFATAFIDASFSISGEGSNIGLGILSLFVLPAGILLVLSGLLLALFSGFKQK